jgi:hypothetical protein
MQTPTKLVQKLVFLGMFVAVQLIPDALAQINLGQVQVSTIGHRFDESPGQPDPSYVRDLLVDQDQSSGGGGMLSSISANFDINNQFILTISAPPGQRFLVQPPDGHAVRFIGSLMWHSPLPGGTFAYGTVAVSFGDLVGNLPPDYYSKRSTLSKTHTFFGFNDVYSFDITNDLEFSSITLIATVPSENSNSGTLTYVPDTSVLGFHYETFEDTDPGGFVSIVPEPSTINLGLFSTALVGVCVWYRRRTRGAPIAPAFPL